MYFTLFLHLSPLLQPLFQLREKPGLIHEPFQVISLLVLITIPFCMYYVHDVYNVGAATYNIMIVSKILSHD